VVEQVAHANLVVLPTVPSTGRRAHRPGTCIERHAEAVCRCCAAAFVGVSLSTFDDRVRPGLAFIRLGSKALFPVVVLRKWIADNTEEGQCPEKRGPGASTVDPTRSSGRSSGADAGRLVSRSTFPQTDLGRKLRAKLRVAG
jgi:hypothetical protein